MSLFQTIRCKLGKHIWKSVRNRHWVQSECVHCGAHGATHFIPLMKSVDDCEGFDDPEERCPRHPNDCLCWDVRAPSPSTHLRVSEIIAKIRHQLEINVQIAEDQYPEGPIVDGKRVKGLTHSQDILAQHIRDHLSELELVIVSPAPAPSTHGAGLPPASDIEKLGGWTLSHDFVDQLARKAEEETTYPCTMEVAEHIALAVADILRSSPPPQHQKTAHDEFLDASEEFSTENKRREAELHAPAPVTHMMVTDELATTYKAAFRAVFDRWLNDEAGIPQENIGLIATKAGLQAVFDTLASEASE
ncbi:hypothetical protein EDE05_12851 [Neorhizobium sp. R1-B]|uniref:hypothetical protein n=1 Tax=Neorhizobium sp. R1-B TaxID=2485162 RepID=UPI0010646BC0|nr:hypothetical protein [Neorhizobium sp. R1-B]TDX72630.1 hypothetical protein EDE05_12851 [Neorhizobium sp. R1-B]